MVRGPSGSLEINCGVKKGEPAVTHCLSILSIAFLALFDWLLKKVNKIPLVKKLAV